MTLLSLSLDVTGIHIQFKMFELSCLSKPANLTFHVPLAILNQGRTFFMRASFFKESGKWKIQRYSMCSCKKYIFLGDMFDRCGLPFTVKKEKKIELRLTASCTGNTCSYTLNSKRAQLEYIDGITV